MLGEARRVLCSRVSVLIFIMILISLMGYSIPSWMYSQNWGEGNGEDALQLSTGGVYFGSIVLILPFCAALPAAVFQVDEIRYRFFELIIVRKSTKRYAIRKNISMSLCSAIPITSAFLIHALVWSIVVPCNNSPLFSVADAIYQHDCLYYDWLETGNGLLIYLSTAFFMGFCSSIWSIVALGVSIWLPDRVLVMLIPVSLYRLWSGNLPKYIFGIDLPHPSALYNDALTGSVMLKSVLVYIIILIIANVAFYIGVQRRGSNA